VTVRYQLRWLEDPSTKESQAVAELHHRLLPTSPLAALGRRFLGRWYYRALPRMKLIQVLVGEIDGRVQGFIAVTTDADGFMRRALRAGPLALGAHLALAVFADPRRLIALREAAAISASRRSQSTGGGELLSFAVDGSVRGAEFVRATGIRMAGDLLAGAVQRLREQGVPRIRSLVDADNRAVRIMYGAMGWTLAAESVAGWRTPQVEYQLDPQGAASA
jgi:hypothetical protein